MLEENLVTGLHFVVINLFLTENGLIIATGTGRESFSSKIFCRSKAFGRTVCSKDFVASTARLQGNLYLLVNFAPANEMETGLSSIQLLKE
jgi:hypothetical protein